MWLSAYEHKAQLLKKSTAVQQYFRFCQIIIVATYQEVKKNILYQLFGTWSCIQNFYTCYFLSIWYNRGVLVLTVTFCWGGNEYAQVFC